MKPLLLLTHTLSLPNLHARVRGRHQAYPTLLETHSDHPLVQQLRWEYERIAMAHEITKSDENLLGIITSPYYPDLLTVCQAHLPLPKLSCLGKGAVGTVYHSAHCLASEDNIKAVAIKEMRLNDSDDIKQILIEIENHQLLNTRAIDGVSRLLWAQMPNPSTVQLVFERLEGIEGADIVERLPMITLSGPHGLTLEVKMPLAILAALAHRLLSILEGVHEAGLVHGDLKPSNIFFDHQSGVKLIDFGFSGKAGTPITGSTPGFRPPDAPSVLLPQRDIFQVGASLIWWLHPEKYQERWLERIARQFKEGWHAPLGDFLLACLAGRSKISLLKEHPFMQQRASPAELSQWLYTSIASPVQKMSQSESFHLLTNIDYFLLQREQTAAIPEGSRVVCIRNLAGGYADLSLLRRKLELWRANPTGRWVPFVGHQFMDGELWLAFAEPPGALTAADLIARIRQNPSLRLEIPAKKSSKKKFDPFAFDGDDPVFVPLQRKPLPIPHPRLIAAFLLEVLRALQPLHAHGLEHGRLYPSNLIMVNGRLLLTGAFDYVAKGEFLDLPALADLFIAPLIGDLSNYECPPELTELIALCQTNASSDELIAVSRLLQSVNHDSAWFYSQVGLS